MAMLLTIRRWFSSEPDGPDCSEIAAWAESRGWVLKRPREMEGFVIEGKLGRVPWRLEWGPSQRPYIDEMELRLRAELGLPSDLQSLVVNRRLLNSIENETFERYTEGVQTNLDTDTPEEMRWLVMFPRVSNADLLALAGKYVAVTSSLPWLQQWLVGPLMNTMAALPGSCLSEDDPFVLMTLRGRVVMRCAMENPDLERIKALVALYELAVAEALRVADHWFAPGASTKPDMWVMSDPPGDPDGVAARDLV